MFLAINYNIRNIEQKRKQLKAGYTNEYTSM